MTYAERRLSAAVDAYMHTLAQTTTRTPEADRRRTESRIALVWAAERYVRRARRSSAARAQEGTGDTPAAATTP